MRIKPIKLPRRLQRLADAGRARLPSVRTLSFRLPAIMVSFAVAAAATTCFLAYQGAAVKLHVEAEQRLRGILDARASALLDNIKTVRQDLALNAAADDAMETLDGFQAALDEFGPNWSAEIRRLYVKENRNPAYAKFKLDRAPDQSLYSRVHGRFHPRIRQLMNERSYSDVYLIDDQGRVVYTAHKRAEFGENVDSERLQADGLAEAFRQAKADPGRTDPVFTDFSPYAPAKGAAAAFMAMPVRRDGVFLGVLAYRLPVGRLNEITQRTEGMGRSGETLLVGQDLLYRSDTRFVDHDTALVETLDSVTVRLALSGESGVVAALGRSGAPVMAAFAPFDYLGVRWAILAEIEESEITAPAVELRDELLKRILAVAAAAGLIGILIGRNLTKPIAAMTSAMTRLAGGDMDADIPALQRRDEIGAMAQAVQVFKDGLHRASELAAERRQDAERHETRAKRLLQLTQDFDAVINNVAGAVQSAAGAMKNTAQDLTDISGKASLQAEKLADDAQDAGVNVQSAAGAAEEMSASISEVSRQVSASLSANQRAVETAGSVGEIMDGLKNALRSIDVVVETIARIAAQTSLLAMNATIEAARAGEAGKGFAVVAGEVKVLADRTAQATATIGPQVAEIQRAADLAAASVEDIASVIRELNDISTSVDAAMEMQQAAAREIAQGTHAASMAAVSVSGGADQMKRAVANANDASGSVLDAAERLAQQSQTLRTEVEVFIAAVQSAR